MRRTRGLPKLQAAEKKTNAKCKAGAAARTEDEVYFMTLEPEPRRIWSPFASQTLHQPKGGEKSGWRSTRVCNQIIYQKSRNYYE